jgi:23S rRNA (guanine745-N1)-methyltransferase
VTVPDPPVPTGALGAVVGVLRCPTCAGALAPGGATLRCEGGHRFDVARQGYVNLRTGAERAGTADDAAMVGARERFLAQGHYAPIAHHLAALAQRYVPADGPGFVTDLAAGTGYHLAHVLDALPGHRGIAVDLSAPALRRAARAHPRGAAVGADVWSGLPLADASMGVVTCVFGPRNAAEAARVLVPGGAFVVVTPTGEHLRELADPLGMLHVDQDKEARLGAALAGYALVHEERLAHGLALDHGAVADLVGMGPSARHVTPEELARRVAALPPGVEVTASVRFGVYRPPPR